MRGFSSSASRLTHNASPQLSLLDLLLWLSRSRLGSLSLGHRCRLGWRRLDRLAQLVTEADLDRRGMHPSLGEVTLRELLATWAVHDLDHVSQIFAGMAGSHDAEVGPWKAYLGILLRRDDPAAVAG